MVAPLIPLVIAGVRIAAPIAAKYVAGKMSKRAAVKASKELSKKRQSRTNPKSKRDDLPVYGEKSFKEKLRESNTPAGIRANRAKEDITGTTRADISKRLDEQALRRAAPRPKPDRKVPKLTAKETKDYLKMNKNIREIKEKLGKKGLLEDTSGFNNAGSSNMRADTFMKGKYGLKGKKKGGAVKVKKCRMDGIALRGKTRAKERSK